MSVVIAGGGTAGHVNPALALARGLSSDEVIFAGTTRGAEATLVPQAGYRLEVIEVRGYDRSKPATIVATALQALRATQQAIALLRRTNAEVVVGMGGYVSLPACVAARRLRLPVVLHEQNIVFGLANRLCRPFAHTIGVLFEETLQRAGRKGVLVGNPVAPEIVNIDRDNDRMRAYQRFDLEPDRKTLLVFGGSQGAQRINEAALGLTSEWAERGDVQILHIAGRLQAETFVEQARQRLGAGSAGPQTGGAGSAGPQTGGSGKLIYRVEGYVDTMVLAYAVADLALCRGGATTVAELGVVGLPSIVVPYPYHRDRQQERHGRVLERAGAALVLPDEVTTAERVGEVASELLADDGRLKDMRESALGVGRPDAAAALARLVEEAAG
jgi:UDP-N-acetylglucosamine--N-acetylmuramyl-(pentapeptide) pyrophosphoryl-undecaprenol N-acetylglucosamine transferase